MPAGAGRAAPNMDGGPCLLACCKLAFVPVCQHSSCVRVRQLAPAARTPSRVRACVRVCVHVRALVGMSGHMRVCVSAC